jgi:hypothetical protein
MPRINSFLVLGGAAAAAYYFRTQIETALGFGATAAPAITAGGTAASSATAAGASPAQAAAAAATAINSTPPAPIAVIAPTIQVDNPNDHNGLVALATASDNGSLGAAQASYPQQAAYRLTTAQWNFYHATGTGTQDGLIGVATAQGSNAYPAATYLAIRQGLGLV